MCVCVCVCVCVRMCVLSSLTGLWGCGCVRVAACATTLGVQLSSGLWSNKRSLINQRTTTSNLSGHSPRLCSHLMLFSVAVSSPSVSLSPHLFFCQYTLTTSSNRTALKAPQGNKLNVIAIRYQHRKCVVKVTGR